MAWDCWPLWAMMILPMAPNLAATPAGNGFARVRLGDGHITSLQIDATGQGHWRSEAIAEGGSIGPVHSAEVRGRKLMLVPAESEITWDLPFLRSGYYDAELHLNFAGPTAESEAIRRMEPIRGFVTSAGQYVLIEYFKRLPLGSFPLHCFNVAGGGQLLLRGDTSVNYDLKLTCLGQERIPYEIGERFIRLKIGTSAAPITIEILRRGSLEVPGDSIALPAVSFDPEFRVVYPSTCKVANAGPLATELLRMGIYYDPSVRAGGEWGLDSVGVHMMDDPRSRYLKSIRSELLEGMSRIGYDRFDHFGMLFCWGRFPDYGAPGLLNVPPENAPFDMRMIHLNGQYIQTIAQYVLATGDTDLLRARSARWVSTDGDEKQPVCGASATQHDYVLAAGDCRLDGKVSAHHHTLGQAFTASAPFRSVSIRLGTESKDEAAHGVAVVRPEPGGDILARAEFELSAGETDKMVTIAIHGAVPAGKYFVEVSDDSSGKRYFGPGIYWLTDPDAHYSGGDATTGPFSGSIYDRLALLLDYLRLYTGGARDNLSYYQDDPEYNVADQKSGRHGVCTENSFWENAGGAYDAFEGLWYNVGCSAMADMAQLMRDTRSADRYRRFRELADKAYNKKYWHTVEENCHTFSRYHACEDWDGSIHDYGYTYYNLEAACYGVTGPDRARDILWWLDRGQYKPDESLEWKDDIYSIWQIAPPFNTINNYTWLNLTGRMPYTHAVANGGTRLTIEARDLRARSRYLSADNMHERNVQVLTRFASPDRLTGGRIVDDPGGRGRWHFGHPDTNVADIEGFREIFWVNGTLATYMVAAYLGLDYSPHGLHLRPRVPSGVNGFVFRSIGYWGALFDFSVSARRTQVAPKKLDSESSRTRVFVPASRFDKAGVEVRHSAQGEIRLSLTLERHAGGKWVTVGRNWLSHVKNGQWVWVSSDQWLAGGAEYRLRLHDVQSVSGDPVALVQRTGGRSGVRLVAEETRLEVKCRLDPNGKRFALTREPGGKTRSQSMDLVLGPGDCAVLRPLGK